MLAQQFWLIGQSVGCCGVLDGAKRRQFAGGFQHRIGDRADMRMDALEVAQHVEMQRRRLQALRPAFAQPLEMPVGGFKLGAAQLGLFREAVCARPRRRRS